MTLKLRSLALLLVFVLLLAGGCGKQEEAYITLNTCSILGSGADKEVYSSVLREFSAENSGVMLRDTTTPPDDAYKLGLGAQSLYEGVQPPDVVYMSLGTFQAVKDNFVSVEDIRADYPDFAAGVPQGAIDSLGGFGVPIRCDIMGAAVNPALISPPFELTNLVTSAEQLRKDGKYLFSCAPGESAMLAEMLCVSASGGAATAQSATEHGAALIEAYSALIDAGAFAPEHSDALTLFSQGQAAVCFITGAGLTRLPEQLDAQFVPLIGSGSDSIVFGSCSEGFFITKRAYSSPEKRDFAVRLVEKMTAQAVCERFASGGRLSVCASDGMTGKAAQALWSAERRLLSSCVTQGVESWSKVCAHFEELALGKATASQAVELLSDPELTLEELLEREARAAQEALAAMSQSDISGSDIS